MKNRFKIIVASFLLLAGAGGAYAQSKDFLEALYSKMSTSVAETVYTYVTETSGVKVTGHHELELQSDLWHMKGNGLEIWCDGQTVWTTDPVAKEVIIEPAAQNEASELVNPALIFTRLNDWFDVKEKRELPQSKSVLYILRPKPEMNINVEFLNVEIGTSDGMIRKGSFALEDGASVNIDFISMAMKPKKPVSYYRPSQSFDASWIVTDLR